MIQPVRAVPEVPSVETLVVTVGGSPVPVLLAMLALRPRQVVALHTAQSRVVWDRVEQLYRRLVSGGPGGSVAAPLEVEAIQVPPHDAAETVDSLAGLGGRTGWSLAYGGGTPTMSAAAFRTWWQAHRWDAAWDEVEETAAKSPSDAAASGAWYAAEDGDVLLRQDGLFVESRDILAGLEVSLVDLMRLHGAEPQGREALWREQVPQLTPMNVASQIISMPSVFTPDQRQQVEKDVRELITEGLAIVAARGGAKVYPVGAFEVVDSGLHVHPGPLVDIAVVQGLALGLLRLAVFPSSTGKPSSDQAIVPAGAKRITFNWRAGAIKEQLFDAEAVARSLGGIRARSAVLTLSKASRYGPSPEVVAVVDVGPDFRPGRLGLPTSPNALPPDPLPDMAGFNGKDLTQALLECSMSVPLTNCDDLSRWIAWETES
jgi:hypothetical protein